MKCVLLTLAASACASLCLAAPTNTFTAADASKMAAFVTASQMSDGTFGSTTDSFLAFGAFKNLKTKLPNKGKLCASTAAATEAAVAGESVLPLANGISLLAAFGCKQKPSEAAVTALLTGLESEDVKQKLASIEAAVYLKKARNAAAPADEQLLEQIVAVDEGWGDMVDEAAVHAGLGFSLAALVSNTVTLTAEAKTAIDNIFEKVEEVMDLAEDVGTDALQFIDDENEEDKYANVRATCTVLGGAAELALALKKNLAITPAKVSKFADFVLQHKAAGTAAEAYFFTSGVKLFTSPYATNPVALRVLPHGALSMSSVGKAATVKVAVTDIAGNAIGGARVTLGKVVYMADTEEEETALESPKAFRAVGGGVYAINFLSLVAPKHGLYTAFTSVEPSSARYAPIASASSTFKVITAMEVDGFKLLTQKAGARATTAAELSYPAKASKPLELDFTDTLKIEFKVKSVDDASFISPHQVFAKFTKVGGGRSAVVVAAPDEDDEDLLALTLNVEEAMESKFKGEAGDYDVTVVVGDFYCSNAIVWKVGTVKLSFPETVAAPAAPVELFGPWPTIEHVFSPPARRPMDLFALLFTVAALAPVAWLFQEYSKLGVNADAFPVDMPARGYAAAFHGGLALQLVLLLMFWLSTPMLDTLRRSVPVVLVTVFAGQKALCAHCDATQAPMKSKSE